MLNGGTTGPAIVSGSAEKSLLYQRVRTGQMPLGGPPLSGAELELIRNWIERSAPASPSPAFAGKIRPIFAERCYQCHGPDVQQDGLRLDSLAAALKGSASGRIVIPGDSEKSRLVRRLVGLELEEPGIPRHGYSVWHDGSQVGRVTSGTKSPTLGTFIGLAYVAVAAAAPGTPVAVDIRGRHVPAHVVERPFYRRVR